MSVKLMAEIWKCQLPAMDKIVLLKLADCANDQGQSIWPSRETVAVECGCTVRHVQRILRRYQSTGLIKLVGHENTAHRTREYAFDLAVLASTVTGDTQSRGDSQSRVPVTHSHRRGDSQSPKPSSNHHSEPSVKDTSTPVPTTSPLPEKTIPTYTSAPDGAEKVVDLESRKPAKQYAWQGETFRLTIPDWRKWRRQYWSIHDMKAMLDRIDEYYAENPKPKGSMMFAFSGWLNNEHQKQVGRGATMPEWLRVERANAG